MTIILPQIWRPHMICHARYFVATWAAAWGFQSLLTTTLVRWIMRQNLKQHLMRTSYIRPFVIGRIVRC